MGSKKFQRHSSTDPRHAIPPLSHKKQQMYSSSSAHERDIQKVLRTTSFCSMTSSLKLSALTLFFGCERCQSGLRSFHHQCCAAKRTGSILRRLNDFSEAAKRTVRTAQGPRSSEEKWQNDTESWKQPSEETAWYRFSEPDKARL